MKKVVTEKGERDDAGKKMKKIHYIKTKMNISTTSSPMRRMSENKILKNKNLRNRESG